jgi:heme/copper-type cytochrome/quinol oxidase subunit 4
LIDFTDRPTRNPLMWTLAGFVAYMAFAVLLALVAVCAFLHLESKRKKKHQDMTALQQLGLGLD